MLTGLIFLTQLEMSKRAAVLEKSCHPRSTHFHMNQYACRRKMRAHYDQPITYIIINQLITTITSLEIDKL